MDNKCPKCKEKLSLFYLKQECPHCGCDLINYDLERRLEEDSVNAEAEFEKLNNIIISVKTKTNKIILKFKRKDRSE